MSFSTELASLESWWHDLIAHLFKHPAAATVAPAAIQAVANVAAQPAPAKPAFDWTPYAGQTDRSAFMVYVQKTGEAPSPSEEARAYAAGVVKTVTNDQSSGDLHNSPDLGLGGHPYAVPLSSGTEPVTKVVNVTFKLAADHGNRRLMVSPNPVCRLASVHVQVSGPQSAEGEAQLNTAMGGEEAKFLVGTFPDGDYSATLTIVGYGDVAVDLANA